MAAILVVDDEKNIRLTLLAALEPLDRETATAVTGEEALVKVRSGRFSVVLLDIRMPGMDGMEVLRQIREEHPEVAVVMISAHGTIELATEAMKMGAVDFIEKPFTPSEIRSLIERIDDPARARAASSAAYGEHLRLAREAIERRLLEPAAEHVRLAVAADSTRPEALNLRGAIMELRGDWLEALKQYRAAIAVSPGYAPADRNLERVVVRHVRGSDIDLGDSPPERL